MPVPLQLISTDFDGTLHSDFTDPHVPVALQEQIRQLQDGGITWLINTGRELADLHEGITEAKISTYPDYVVVVEREIYRCNGESFIPLTQWNDNCAATQTAIFEKTRKRLPELFDWVNENFDAQVYEDSWSPFCLIARNNSDADVIQQRVKEHFSDEPQLICVRNDIYARLSHIDYTKGTAMSEVARRLDIPPEGILAAGDHWNDLSMLQSDLAQWLVAPANAVPAVKEHVLSQGGFVSNSESGLGVLEGIQWALSTEIV